MANHSIFNDVLGPVLAGPSSSHSAGCARIGRLTGLLWGRPVRKARVVYDSQGSYPKTCVGQGSNFGFTGGLLGMKNDDPSLKDAERIAVSRGVEITFAQEKLSARHPNEARIDVFDDTGEVGMSVLTLSVGGGMFRIVEMDGYRVEMDGGRAQLYVCCSRGQAQAVSAALASLAGEVVAAENGTDAVLLCAVQLRCVLDEAAARAGRLPGVIWVRSAPVILPVEICGEERPLFSTAAQAMEYAEATEKALWELAVEYECALGRVTGEEVMAQAMHTLDVMKAAANPPDPEKTPRFGFLPYQCEAMGRSRGTVPTVDTGCLQKAMFYALAVMENSCAHNIVSAAPTAGSSGVIPAAVLAVGEELGRTKEEIARGLLAAGLAGAFIANQATFGAEEAGCQAENGAASAMAACGVVQLLGDTVRQGFDAASLALQNLLGLICDPVGGLTEIPCISRNIAAMGNAVLSANMVMLGFDPVIPFDQTIETMLRVGRQLPAALRCTCGGGLCLTPAAEQAVRRICRED